MNFVRLLPVILSAVLIAAHYLRSGSLLLVLGSLGFPLLLLVRKPWAVRVVQVLLILASLEWVLSMLFLAADRVMMGQDWTRMGIILGSVALFTAGSAFVFVSKPLKARYGLVKEKPRTEEGDAEAGED